MRRRSFLRAALGALAAPVLPGCLEGPTGPRDDRSGDPRLTASVGAPTTNPERGATELGLGEDRDGFLYVPPALDLSAPVPLMLVLHGFGAGADMWTPLFPACDERGFCLLAVDSRDVTWDRAEGSYGPDVRFIDRALSHAFDRVPVDPRRLALAGFSDGASYTLSLGPDNGELFSHLVAFSPGFAAPTEERVGRPAIFVSHGTRDGILSVRTTRDRIVPALEGDGYEVTYLEFDGGHTVGAEVANAAFDWYLGSGT